MPGGKNEEGKNSRHGVHLVKCRESGDGVSHVKKRKEASYTDQKVLGGEKRCRKSGKLGKGSVYSLRTPYTLLLPSTCFVIQ